MLPNNINNIYINTGNLISYKEFKKKATLSPSEEVFDSVSETFKSCLSSNHIEDLSLSDGSFKLVNKAHIRVDKEDRVNLKVTVKVFLEQINCEDLKAAIEGVMYDLGIQVIDSFILSLPPLLPEEKFNLDHIKTLWNELEKLVHEKKILTIGISDLDAGELAELYNWTKVKPSVNQVNLESCCVMPPEMTAFARENDIQLLTHNDPKVLLPKDMLIKVLETNVSAPETWKLKWIVKYSVVIKCRGIIQNKGYLLHFFKDS